MFLFAGDRGPASSGEGTRSRTRHVIPVSFLPSQFSLLSAGIILFTYKAKFYLVQCSSYLVLMDILGEISFCPTLNSYTLGKYCCTYNLQVKYILFVYQLKTYRMLKIVVVFWCNCCYTYREEAARMWEKRDAEWARESKARERLMREVSRSTEFIYR